MTEPQQIAERLNRQRRVSMDQASFVRCQKVFADAVAIRVLTNGLSRAMAEVLSVTIISHFAEKRVVIIARLKHKSSFKRLGNDEPADHHHDSENFTVSGRWREADGGFRIANAGDLNVTFERDRRCLRTMSGSGTIDGSLN